MMNFLFLKYARLLPLLCCCFFVSCNSTPDDKETQERVNEKMKANNMYEGVTATVENGVVTLTGDCDGDNCATAIANNLKQETEVDSVVNNIQQAPTETDLTLRTSAQSIASKYPGVQADVDRSVITLRGTISKDQLQPLMNELSALQAQKIDNQMVVK